MRRTTRSGKPLAAAALALLLLSARPLLAEGETDAGTPETAAEASAGTAAETAANNASIDMGTGTAVLVGAGAYTFMRGKWQAKKREQVSERGYVHFENHTRNGTETQEEKDIF